MTFSLPCILIVRDIKHFKMPECLRTSLTSLFLIVLEEKVLIFLFFFWLLDPCFNIQLSRLTTRTIQIRIFPLLLFASLGNQGSDVLSSLCMDNIYEMILFFTPANYRLRSLVDWFRRFNVWQEWWLHDRTRGHFVTFQATFTCNWYILRSRRNCYSQLKHSLWNNFEKIMWLSVYRMRSLNCIPMILPPARPDDSRIC
jgi:hypothetical protein